MDINIITLWLNISYLLRLTSEAPSPLSAGHCLLKGPGLTRLARYWSPVASHWTCSSVQCTRSFHTKSGWKLDDSEQIKVHLRGRGVFCCFCPERRDKKVEMESFVRCNLLSLFSIIWFFFFLHFFSSPTTVHVTTFTRLCWQITQRTRLQSLCFSEDEDGSMQNN